MGASETAEGRGNWGRQWSEKDGVVGGVSGQKRTGLLGTLEVRMQYPGRRKVVPARGIPNQSPTGTTRLALAVTEEKTRSYFTRPQHEEIAKTPNTLVDMPQIRIHARHSEGRIGRRTTHDPIMHSDKLVLGCVRTTRNNTLHERPCLPHAHLVNAITC